MIYIIGGSGFIGTRLVKRLQLLDAYSFKIIDKVISKEFPSLTTLADIRFIDDLRNVIDKNSILINLAAEHKDNVTPSYLYEQVNVGGAINICNIAREKNIKTIIFTSSVAVYGFAKPGTAESGEINPFNEYGRTKYEAERIYKDWQKESAEDRRLIIIRPTVVFGEQNRGNVYNLFHKIYSGFFIMIGSGKNSKSIAYVENLAAFIEYSVINFNAGVHLYNFVDKPDLTMNELVECVKNILGLNLKKYSFRVPYFFGILVGKIFDFISLFSDFDSGISSIRIKKFCTNSVYESAIESTGFVSPISLKNALRSTLTYEFLEKHEKDPLYFSE